jgi:hypothetical protein
VIDSPLLDGPANNDEVYGLAALGLVLANVGHDGELNQKFLALVEDFEILCGVSLACTSWSRYTNTSSSLFSKVMNPYLSASLKNFNLPWCLSVELLRITIGFLRLGLMDSFRTLILSSTLSCISSILEEWGDSVFGGSGGAGEGVVQCFHDFDVIEGHNRPGEPWVRPRGTWGLLADEVVREEARVDGVREGQLRIMKWDGQQRERLGLAAVGEVRGLVGHSDLAVLRELPEVIQFALSEDQASVGLFIRVSTLIVRA